MLTVVYAVRLFYGRRERDDSMKDDLISRRMITAHLKQRLWETALNNVGIKCDADEVYSDIADNRLDSWMNELCIKEIPSTQPDGIPLEWIDKHLEWLDNCDNDFAQLAKVGIRAMVEIWKKDKT